VCAGQKEYDVQFLVLGPLTVRRDRGDPVPITQPRQRNVLSLLLLNPNQVLSSAQILDWLWGRERPPTAAGAVRTHIWALRSRPELRTRLRSRASGYSIQVGTDELDVARFRRLVEEGRGALRNGRPDVGADRLGRALQLWREPELVDLPGTPAAAAVAARLREEHRAARAAWVEVQLMLGCHHELMPYMYEVVTRNPLDEQAWGQLMLAMYRCGRRAEALMHYQTLRTMLIDELGVEPAGELQGLHRQILAGDIALDDLGCDRRPADLLPLAAGGTQAAGWTAGFAALW
jgi:DNA-binding SARP family transcriptional activator